MATSVIITGGARGLGRATAEALLGRFDRIILADREAATGAATAKELGESVSFHPLDISDPAAIDAFLDSVAASAPPVVALVNNAGVTTPTPFLESTPELWDSVLDVNLRGTFLMSQAWARRALKLGWAAGGDAAVVNIASTAGLSARPGSMAYASSKAGIVMLTKVLAQELGPHGVRVNAVAPAMIPLPHKPTRPLYDSAFQAMVPLKRRGTPKDIATVVRFLLSEDAGYVSGVTIPVDGGFLAGRMLPPSVA